MTEKPNVKNPDRELPPWPGTIRSEAELDSALEAGLASGECELNILEIAERTLTKSKNG